MIKIITLFISFLLVFSCEDSNKKSNALKKTTKLSSLKDSNSYALGVNQAEMMLKKSKLDTRDFNQKELIKGFKENLYTSPILDSMCQYSIEDFIGKNGQSLNSDFAARGSYCIGKLYAHNFLTIWSKSKGVNRLNLPIVSKGFEDLIKKNIVSITMENRKKLIKRFYENLVNDVSKVMIDALKERSNVEEIENAIYIEKIKKGTGAFPTDSSNVSIDYILTSPFMDTLENTYKRFSNQKPPYLNIKYLYPGMRFAIPRMQKNGIYRVYLPFEMVEDEKLPFPYICFYIELLDFKENSIND